MLVKNNEINISEKRWKKLNKKHSKEEIKNLISSAIQDNDLPLPYKKISKEECKKDFKCLKHLDSSENIIKSKWFTRYDYKKKYFLKNIVFKSTPVGNKSSNYFHQKSRWLCDSINAPSPYRTWTTERFRQTLLNALWSLKVKQVNSTTLRTCIGLRKYIASQFRPSTAKSIIEYFDAKHILDFSSGWGDRLQGFLSSNAISYTGIDPNENLIQGYKKQIKYFGKNKTVHMISACAEDTKLKGKYDLIFTSPPYFNVERYTQEDNQSFKRYKKLEDWLTEFLFKSIKRAWKKLEVNGHLVLNISDVYANHRINKICDPMNDYISKLSGAKYVGCYCYEMKKRPNSGALKGKEGKFGEPVWVWKKIK